ncbi:hypothetical protein HBH56_158320 [Parastagonospora nodorum]|uniref:Uncharacterized protein n=1 Tax=Phaeosphaeria nodorum (strain SN15 / ATCC MYA-4574 / FGSC 10173) TaxID=321614 RepID=A0A7U2F2F1_PHANO|nr:hypothetical protein HBH56_158320 [Parastagonospora nodorum]QRC97397.1 hypothetical protein JI435_088210 [Parastagonospora nodorum SN15]KAH3922982.1 hypothetical protein HBH54_216420 [Parastagonospora nodorum]KAH4050429.1 hypothetical protein HBH49_132400 [Parastagonospora nodorum]KAH4127595.1 hypothetical protein HBH45_214410 [Parastagonospora nodorum]
MDYTPNDAGNPAARYTYLQSSDEQQANNNATAQPGPSRLPQLDGYQPHPATPLPHYGQVGAFSGYPDAAVSSQPGYHHQPPTPPGHEDDVQKLLDWHAQQHAQHQASEQVPRTIDPNGYANRHNYAGSFNPPQAPLPDAAPAYRYSNTFGIPMRQAKPYGFGQHQYQRPPSPDLQQARASLEQLRQQALDNPKMPNLDDRRSFSYTADPDHIDMSPSTLALLHEVTSPQPPIQQSPTHTLSQQPRPVTPPHHYAPTLANAAIGPSPGHDGITPIDEETIRKQQEYVKNAQRSAERRRQKKLSSASSKAGSMAPPQAVLSTKRKRSTKKSTGSTSTPGPKRRKPLVMQHGLPDADEMYAPHHGGLAHAPTHDQDNSGFGILYPVHQPQAGPTNFMPSYAPIFNTSIFDVPRNQRLLSPPEPAPPARIDWDTQPQDITANYADYKWSVILFQLHKACGFEFAESWLDNLVQTNNLGPPSHRWHAHSSRGFIQDGDALSFIALHNAADPFEWGLSPTSTTSIGVYGRFWQDRDEMIWRTFAPGFSSLLDYCQHMGGISVKQTWKFDNPKASERRFHRAYWLSARMQPTKDLLHHSGMETGEMLVEMYDDGFEVSEKDLRSEKDWNRTEEQSQDAWNAVLEKNEEIGDVLDGGARFEHVFIGSTEVDNL